MAFASEQHQLNHACECGPVEPGHVVGNFGCSMVGKKINDESSHCWEMVETVAIESGACLGL